MPNVIPIHRPNAPAGGEAEFQPTLSPRFLTYVSQYLLDQDIDPEPLFTLAGIGPGNDDDAAHPIEVGRICRLFELVASSLERPYFGLELSHGYHYESGSMLILAFMAAPTVGSALQTLVRYDRYVDSAIEINLDEAGGLACFEVNVLAAAQDSTEHLTEYLTGFIASALAKATRQAVPIERVAFTHTTTKAIRPVEQFFQARVVYGATHNAFHFDAQFLQQPLRSANSLLYEVLREALHKYHVQDSEHSDFMLAVHREVLRQFRNGTPTASSIAASLQLSPRSLRRRLADHDKRFQQVKNEARLQRARFYLLNTAMPLTEIAYELGYSEPSAFSRAFKEWTGSSPQEMRNSHASVDGAERH